MRAIARALSWFALGSTGLFVVLTPGASLHAELLSVPLLALAIAQLPVLKRGE